MMNTPETSNPQNREGQEKELHPTPAPQHSDKPPRDWRSLMFSYGSAILGVVVATLLRMLFAPMLQETAPFVFYFLFVLFASWFFGLGPALLSLILGTFAAIIFFISPTHTLTLPTPADRLSVITFLIVSFTVSLITTVQRKSRSQAIESAQQAQSLQYAAQESQELLSTTLRSIGDGVIATDKSGHITFMNTIAEQLTGWREAEAKGKHCSEVFHITNQSTGAEVESPVEHVIREGVIVGLANHTILTSRDGTQRPIADSGAPIRDLQGNLFGVVLVFRDVTEQSQAIALQERLVAIVESSEDAIISTDLNGIITSWNPAAERAYGYSQEEAIGKSKTLVIPPNQSDELPNILSRIRAGERIEHYETRRLRHDGTLFDAFLSVSPLKDVEGQIVGASTIARDITEQKRSEARRHFLNQASAVLGSSLDYRQTLQTVARLAVPEIADWCAVDMLEANGSVHQVAVAHVDPEKVKWAMELRKRYPPDPNAPHGLYNVLRTGQTELYSHIPEELLARSTQDPEQREIIRQIGFESAMIVSIIARGRILGAISFVTTRESGHHYTLEDQALAEGLAARTAMAIDNAQLYQSAQEEVARRRQTEEAMLQHQTEIEALNERLRRAMSETHHRVKNNLQVISALVSMQVLQHEEAIPIAELHRLNQHIKGLAGIHDLLTSQTKQNESADDISVSAALAKLVPMLQGITNGRQIHWEVQDIRLPVRQGTTLTVLVNELVSNAIKHGKGDIRLSFEVKEAKALLRVEDQGPGFPQGFDPETAAHTGLELIESLSHWDLRGTTHYDNRREGGAQVVIEFPISPAPLEEDASRD